VAQSTSNTAIGVDNGLVDNVNTALAVVTVSGGKVT
jgi:hypothetical protein